MLTVIGFNLLLLVFIYPNVLTLSVTVYGLIAAATIAFIFLGPLVFSGPLLPFRDGMKHAKDELMEVVARRTRLELSRIRDQLDKGTISKEEEEFIVRIQKIGALVDALPIWPFDAQTLKKFFMAYVPLITLSAFASAASALSATFPILKVWLGLWVA